MKKLLNFAAGLLLFSCGAASEKKETMFGQSERMSDSIKNIFDSSLAVPLKGISMVKHPIHTTTYVFEYK